jgi:hypothetical protein
MFFRELGQFTPLATSGQGTAAQPYLFPSKINIQQSSILHLPRRWRQVGGARRPSPTSSTDHRQPTTDNRQPTTDLGRERICPPVTWKNERDPTPHSVASDSQKICGHPVNTG